jgi:hypothetical protein
MILSVFRKRIVGRLIANLLYSILVMLYLFRCIVEKPKAVWSLLAILTMTLMLTTAAAIERRM